MLKELINQENFCITTQRLRLVPLSYKYINEFYNEFNSEITKYQYPDTFKDIESAKNWLANFIQLGKEGKCLECIITDMEGTFIGDAAAYGIDTAAPELGVWIAQKYQLNGYAFEALKGIMDYIRSNQHIDFFIYEADSRNIGSLKLIDKLKGEKQGHEHIVTESGKVLELDMYYIK